MLLHGVCTPAPAVPVASAASRCCAARHTHICTFESRTVVVRARGCGLPPPPVRARSHSGYITFDEFSNVLRNTLRKGPIAFPNYRLKALWCALDADDSNTVHKDEAARFLKRGMGAYSQHSITRSQTTVGIVRTGELKPPRCAEPKNSHRPAPTLPAPLAPNLILQKSPPSSAKLPSPSLLLLQQSGKHRSAPALVSSPSRAGKPLLTAAASGGGGGLGIEPRLRAPPAGASKTLVSDRMRSMLVKHASTLADGAEVVMLVEMNPVASKYLYHDQQKYVQHYTRLSRAIGEGSVASTRYPDDVSFSVRWVPLCAAEAPLVDGWVPAVELASDVSTPCFYDWRRSVETEHYEKHPAVAPKPADVLASNQSWAYAMPLRHGAFEVYAVSGLQGGADGTPPKPRVELLFSKLYSRCWPSTRLVLQRLHRLMAPAMRTREDSFALRRAMGSGESTELRTAIGDLVVLGDSALAHEARRRLEACNAADTALGGALAAARSAAAADAGADAGGRQDRADAGPDARPDGSATCTATVELRASLAANASSASPSVVAEVHRWLDETAAAGAITAAMVAHEATELSSALEEYASALGGGHEALLAAAQELLSGMRAADTTMRGWLAADNHEALDALAGDDTADDRRRAPLLEACSRRVAHNYREWRADADRADAALQRVMESSDASTILGALVSNGRARSQVKEAVQMRLKAVRLSEGGGEEALAPGPAA